MSRSRLLVPSLGLGLLGFGLALPAFADTPLTYQRIDFSTEVAREIPNDLMTATLSLELNDKDVSKLTRQINTLVNDALKTAADYSAVKTSSGSQNTWPVYNSSNRQDGWRGRAEIRLESKDFKATGELISKLQNRLQLNGLRFSVAPETQKSVENSLTGEAVTAFRSRAETLQKAWSANTYKLVQMNLGSAGNPVAYAPMMRAMKLADNTEAMPVQDFAGGNTRLVINISGTIELQP